MVVRFIVMFEMAKQADDDDDRWLSGLGGVFSFWAFWERVVDLPQRALTEWSCHCGGVIEVGAP